MSGGAFNYGYYKIETLQEEILEKIIYSSGFDSLSEIETIAIGTLLKQLGELAKKVKAVEYHFSCDSALEEKDLTWLRKITVEKCEVCENPLLPNSEYSIHDACADVLRAALRETLAHTKTITKIQSLTALGRTEKQTDIRS